MNTFCVFDVKLKLPTKSFREGDENYVLNLKLIFAILSKVLKVGTYTIDCSLLKQCLIVYYRVSKSQKVLLQSLS